MKHHCHAIGCKTETKPEYFMCGHHWKMVPNELQHRIKSAYRPGQCKDKNPSREWVKATLEARNVVREIEKQAYRDENPNEADYQTWMRL